MSVTRRNFLSATGLGGLAAAGAGIIANPANALAGISEKQIQKSWSNAFEPTSAIPKYDPRQKPQPGEKVHEFDIELDISVHEIVPGVKIHAFTYNGTYPGPQLRVPEGDWVVVNFKNKTTELHTIHWHG